jgi:hypothetical protein
MTADLLQRWAANIRKRGDIDISAEIEPCMFGEVDDAPIEDDEISLIDCVATCHKIADRLRELER